MCKDYCPDCLGTYAEKGYCPDGLFFTYYPLMFAERKALESLHIQNVQCSGCAFFFRVVYNDCVIAPDGTTLISDIRSCNTSKCQSKREPFPLRFPKMHAQCDDNCEIFYHRKCDSIANAVHKFERRKNDNLARYTCRNYQRYIASSFETI